MLSKNQCNVISLVLVWPVEGLVWYHYSTSWWWVHLCCAEVCYVTGQKSTQGSLDSPTVPEITPCCLSDPFMNALVNPNCMWLQACTFFSKSGELGLVWVYCSVWMKTCCSLERYVVGESPVLWKHKAQVSRISEPGLMRWPDVSALAGAVPKMVPISYC